MGSKVPGLGRRMNSGRTALLLIGDDDWFCGEIHGSNRIRRNWKRFRFIYRFIECLEKTREGSETPNTIWLKVDPRLDPAGWAAFSATRRQDVSAGSPMNPRDFFAELKRRNV